MRSWPIFWFFLLLVTPACAHAWGMHYWITDASLKKYHVSSFIDQTLQPELLEDFLKAEAPQLSDLFKKYFNWLAARGSKRFIRQEFDATHPTTANFLRAARLNPKLTLYYTRRLLPGETPQYELIPFSKISPYEKEEKNYSYFFENILNQKTTGRSTLITHADEPDWWMDSHLWEITEYGYGTAPYGKTDGVSNVAPFHTQFAHENAIVRRFASEMQDGMALERLELMQQLSTLAFRTGHPYWGFRFASWGMHYIQDLAQPYHAKAVPHANFWFYLKFIFSMRKEQIKKESTQLVLNRHLLFEDFIKGIFRDTYLRPDSPYKEVFSALSEKPKALSPLSDVKNVTELFNTVTKISAASAFAIDRLVVTVYGPSLTQNPGYDIETDTHYNSITFLSQPDSEAKKQLLILATEELKLTAEATQKFLEFCTLH